MNRSRRCLVAALTILMVLPLGAQNFQSDGRWLRCTAAVYRMLQVLGTTSYSVRGSEVGKKLASFSDPLSQPPLNPPRVPRKVFAALARQYDLAGVLRRDRSLLDRNVWEYVSTRASPAETEHLNKQWGPEGQYLSRSEDENRQHVEGCPTCNHVFGIVTEGTRLMVDSELIGYQHEGKPPLTANQGSVLPP